MDVEGTPPEGITPLGVTVLPTASPTASPTKIPANAAFKWIPIVHVLGDRVITKTTASTYRRFIDPGAMCFDPIEGLDGVATDGTELTHLENRLVVSGDVVNVTRAGTYTIHYDCQNMEGAHAKRQTRTVIVTDPTHAPTPLPTPNPTPFWNIHSLRQYDNVPTPEPTHIVNDVNHGTPFRCHAHAFWSTPAGRDAIARGLPEFPTGQPGAPTRSGISEGMRLEEQIPIDFEARCLKLGPTLCSGTQVQLWNGTDVQQCQPVLACHMGFHQEYAVDKKVSRMRCTSTRTTRGSMTTFASCHHWEEDYTGLTCNVCPAHTYTKKLPAGWWTQRTAKPRVCEQMHKCSAVTCEWFNKRHRICSRDLRVDAFVRKYANFVCRMTTLAHMVVHHNSNDYLGVYETNATHGHKCAMDDATGKCGCECL
jgi:hypothetical protein